ncbi:MAG: hypothetical protein SFY67_11925 [Candidatus Melainabacteria bacterium]|nr:hypothetical protein [Candidatus Melainabacteria bacterium]
MAELQLQASIAKYEDLSEKLNELYAKVEDYLYRHGSAKYNQTERNMYLESATLAKAELDSVLQMKLEDSKADFDTLSERFTELKTNIEKKIQELENIANTVKTVADILTIVDQIAQIAAGIAKSM